MSSNVTDRKAFWYLTSDGLAFQAGSDFEVICHLYNRSGFPGDVSAYVAQVSRACRVQKVGAEIRTDTAENFVTDLIVWGFLARTSLG